MRLLDTDVMIDVLRGYAPAVRWLESLEEAPGLPGFVVMELMSGCADNRELQAVEKDVDLFSVHWPTNADCTRAVADFVTGHLSTASASSMR